MSLRVVSLLCATAMLAFSQNAHAKDDTDDDDIDTWHETTQHRFSLTLSGIPLVLSRTLEVTGEYRYSPKVGLAAFVGVGRPSASFWDVGAQARRYLLGDFERGLNIGAEVMFASVSGNKGLPFLSASGLGVGGFVGFKYIAKFGLTIDLNAGYRVYGIGSSEGSEASSSQSSIETGPILRANFGWSF